MWVEDLHPRDEYGRFRLGGVSGRWQSSPSDNLLRYAYSVEDAQTGYKVNTRAMREGWYRVGDLPDTVGTHSPGSGYREGDATARGAWHIPGRYHAGKVPALYTEEGTPLSSLKPEDPRTHKHRQRRGASYRAEDKAEKVMGRRLRDRHDDSSAPVGSDVFGYYLADPTNPVGRRRTARKKRDRKQTVTWIQRLSDRMEGR
jgi:hypothetical protein